MKSKDKLFIFAGISALLISVVVLTKEQIHYVYEALALPFGIYFIWYGIKYNKPIFVIFGAGNLIVDGFLLYKNLA